MDSYTPVTCRKVYAHGCVDISMALEVPGWIQDSYTQALDRVCHSPMHSGSLAESSEKKKKKRFVNELLALTIVEIQAPSDAKAVVACKTRRMALQGKKSAPVW